MSELKVGDIICFSERAIEEWGTNTWWEDYGLTLNDTFIIKKDGDVTWLVECIGNGAKIRLTKYKFSLVKERDPYQDVIQKIKYLDKRYKDRQNAHQV